MSELHLLIVSYFAGILTAAAPCILPLLPIVVGGSVAGADNKKNWWKPFVITGSLAVSVILFTLLLRATTSLLGVPQIVWNSISGIIVILLGAGLLFPHAWEWLALKSGFYNQSNNLMQKTGSTKPGLYKDMLMGASLGPVFTSCSPTYALIVAVILPRSFIEGLSYLIAYALGLASVLLLLAIAGQSVVQKMRWVSNPSGWFRRALGVVFIVVGLAVITGLDRQFQTYVLDSGWYDPIANFEQKLM